MEGTSKIFAEGSIFQVLANEETEDVCNNIDAAWEYLGGLWTVGHAVWAQAYKLEHRSGYSSYINQLKNNAKSKMKDFETAKDLAYPDHCHCFLEGVYYAEIDYLLNKKVPTKALSAMNCQTLCYEDPYCKSFTFIQSTRTCYKHAHNENEVEGKKINLVLRNQFSLL